VQVHWDKWGLAGLTALLTANVYRQAKGLALKGEGCLSDLRMLVEMSRGDILLTRDRELFECAQLARAAMPALRPDVRWVPLP
jgi:hypothetical protein